jgi:hypothetical protein
LALMQAGRREHRARRWRRDRSRRKDTFLALEAPALHSGSPRKGQPCIYG